VTDKRKIPLQMREADLCALETRKEGEPQRISFSLSSETPVERFYGNEILIHSKDAVRLDRLTRNAMPLLFNHNPDDVIGMVDTGSVRDKKLFVDAHLFDTERAREVGAMLAGGLRNVSVGYRIHDAEEDRKTNEVRVTDWEPYEASIVSIPADQSVGFGRVAAPEFEVSFRNTANPAATNGGTKVSNVDTASAGVSADQIETRTFTDAVELEKARKEAIVKLCKANRLDESYERLWVESGANLNKVADDMLRIIAERGRANPESEARLDLSKADTRKYSLLRALRAVVNKDWKDAGLELECNKEISKRLNRLPKTESSFFVPLDVMMRDLPQTGRRNMDAAGTSGSNYLVSTDNQPSSFIDLLRASSVSLKMGVTRLSGLRGNVTIPKLTAGNTGYWLADETTAITESQPTIGQLSLSPKNVAALTELSHQLLQQSSPDAESLVLASIARDIGLAVDVGVLRGSGSAGQPTGIVTTGSIGAFTGTSLAASGFLNAVADVGTANALELGGVGFVTTPAVAALLMDRPNVTSATDGTPLWQGRMEEGTIRGYRAVASTQMSSATALFGAWPSVVLAEWGVLELVINPFSDFTRGLTAVRGWYTCDVGVRYAGAWSYASSIT
jgi:HK97 family phage major capsid protein/HK97 family phage prohead protease